MYGRLAAQFRVMDELARCDEMSGYEDMMSPNYAVNSLPVTCQSKSPNITLLLMARSR